MQIIKNGDLVTEEHASLSLTDKAVWFDFGVYESIKFVQKKAFYPEKHVERFFHSAAVISMELGYSQEEILSWVNKLIVQSDKENGLIRLFAYGDTEQNKKATIYLFALGLTFLPNTYYSKGVKAITYRAERFLPQSKNMNMLVNFLAFRTAQQGDALDAILIDHKGMATEGTRSNLFIVENGCVITPPEEVVLNGVTRDLLMQWALEQNYSVTEEQIPLQRLLAANEVFITSTGMNVLPVVQIDDEVIADGTVGKITKALHNLFRTKHREYFTEKHNE